MTTMQVKTQNSKLLRHRIDIGLYLKSRDLLVPKVKRVFLRNSLQRQIENVCWTCHLWLYAIQPETVVHLSI